MEYIFLSMLWFFGFLVSAITADARGYGFKSEYHSLVWCVLWPLNIMRYIIVYGSIGLFQYFREFFGI